MEARTTSQSQTTTIEPPKTEFIPHRVDPLLSLREAGRLVGVSHTCIGKWIDSGILDAVRGAASINRRVRKSDLIRVSGVAAFARKCPFLFVQESELPADYVYNQENSPLPRTIDKITYFPVHLDHFKDQT